MNSANQISEPNTESSSDSLVGEIGQGRDVMPACVPLVCGGVKGIITFCDDKWALANSAELSTLKRLGGSAEGVSRLKALVEVLNSGLVDLRGLAALNRVLTSIVRCDPPCLAYVPEELRAAVATACAYWEHSNATKWLCWAFAARLDYNLVDGSCPAGALTWDLPNRKNYFDQHWRSTSWIKTVDDAFWKSLSSHKNPILGLVAEASHPETSRRRLLELWKIRNADHRDELRELIAVHPNIPVAPIAKHIGSSLSGRLEYRLAQNKKTTSRVLRLLGRSTMFAPIRWLLALHPDTPKNTIASLLSDEDEAVALEAAHNSQVKAKALEQVVIQATRERQAVLAESPHLSKSTLQELANSPARQVRAAVASHPNLDHQTLKVMATDKTASVRTNAGRNPSISRDLLWSLARDESPRVRRAVASGDEVPKELQLLMAKDPDRIVRFWVSRHTVVSPEAMELLIADEELHVILAEHPSTPHDLLMRLASSEDEWLRGCVAENPLAPREVLEELSVDECKTVRKAVANNPATSIESLVQLATDEDLEVRVAVADNPSAPTPALELLAKDKNKQVRYHVAKHPSCSTTALELLATDRVGSVRQMVAEHTATSVKVLKQLATDRVPFVREAVANHSSCPIDVREVLKAQGYASIPSRKEKYKVASK